jgi:hypothetical protein
MIVKCGSALRFPPSRQFDPVLGSDSLAIKSPGPAAVKFRAISPVRT